MLGVEEVDAAAERRVQRWGTCTFTGRSERGYRVVAHVGLAGEIVVRTFDHSSLRFLATRLLMLDKLAAKNGLEHVLLLALLVVLHLAVDFRRDHASDHFAAV